MPEVSDIAAPVLVVGAAVVGVAAVYFIGASVKDARDRRREQRLADEMRARRRAPRRTGGRRGR